MNNKTKDFFQKNIGYLAVALVCVVYIATAFITIDKTGKTVSRIIADGAFAFLLGFSINRILELQGIMNGEKDEKYQASVKLHGETIIKVSPKINELDEWCEIKNRENLKQQRTRILATNGMSYDDYFDEKGNAKGIQVDESKMKNKKLRKIENNRISCYNKALKLKLTPLSAGELTSEGDKINDIYNFGRTKEQYERQTSVSDVISKILISIVIGYYGVTLVQDFNYANLIWNCLQVSLFIIIGSIKMRQSYSFITGEYRGRIIKKINNLEMFYNYVNKKENVENGT